jgi:hypothetical protein
VFDDLPSLVLAGWAASDDEAFFVGSEGQVLRYQEARWVRLATPTEATLWWIWGTSARDVYAGGEWGTLLHFDGTSWRRIDAGLDATQTIWGIWGASDSDIWIVGGNLRSNGPGFVLRGDGQRFEPVELGEVVPNLFKIWGRNRDEVYAVGDRGVTIQLTGGEPETQYLHPDGVTGPVQTLFTIAGNSSGNMVTVGGVSSALLFEKQGSSAWQFRDLQTVGLNGVAVADSGEAYAVGLDGTIRHRIAGDWLNEDFALDRHYHSAILMGDVTFAVGGDLHSSPAERKGLIVARGEVAAGEINWVVRGDASTPSTGQHDAATGMSMGVGGEPDAGHDLPHAPRPDAGRPDAGHSVTTREDSGANTPLPGPSELCNAQLQCAAASECWLIQGENENRCVTPCSTAAECPAAYGPNPQCAPPGCQTLYTVCMPSDWKGCF